MIMTRRQIREIVFQIIFQADFYDTEELDEQVLLFLDDEEKYAADKEEITDKCLGIFGHLEELDAMINDKTTGWTTERMSKVDLTLIRLALYEIKFENLPKGVAINEAVELAKRYGADSSSGFVNGVLAKFNEE